MVERPTGTVTFLFTDVEGSTAAWERDEHAMARSMEIHDDVLRALIRGHDGVVFATGGDGLAAAFVRADHAVRAAIAAQVGLREANWEGGPTLVVRMGLHTGEAHERAGDYLGPAVNRAARVADTANGGQILCTRTTADVLGTDVGATLVDLGAHLLRDVVEPVGLFRIDHPSCTDTRPPRSGAMHIGNIPSEAEPVIGRHDAVDGVIGDLESHRFVTLTGVGGMGKTTLALATARRIQSDLPDGAWLARLDEVRDNEDVVDLLLSLFGVNSDTDSDVQSLIAALVPRHALLVLDNCEHVVDTVAPLVQPILVSCPRVTVLATSRVPLDVAGEHIFRVPSLTLGADGTAAELFRARSSARAEPAADDEADAVAAICRRLDGLPLAIELAAARSTTLSPRQILEQLDDMLPLLTRGRRHGPERHRTLAAAIAWSFDDLDPRDQTICADLSVFAGSFDLDGARALCDAGDVLDNLDRLVASSLLDTVSEAGERRFRMLEPVRQFVEPHGQAATRERHANYYADLIRALDRRWRAGDDQGTWPTAQRELRNIHAAFNWMCENGRVDDAQAIAAAGWGPILCHFDYIPQSDWAPRSLALDADHVGPSTAAACGVATWGALSRGDEGHASELLRRGRSAIARGSNDDGLLAAAAAHATIYGHPQVLDDEYLDDTARRARESDDLFTRALLCGYLFNPRATGIRADPELIEAGAEAARRLGNHVVAALAGVARMRQPPDDPRSSLENGWENAQRAHSFVVRNSAAHAIGAYEVHFGTVADGLLMLRTAARDWLYRGDIRAAAVVRSMAAGFVRAGDRATASILLSAIGDPKGRHIGILGRVDDTVLAPIAPRASSGVIDLAGAVELACERAEALATRPPSVDGEEIRLTDRQLQVAELVARGFGNKEIARRLDVSRYTVETHVRNILERIDATSRTQIATWLLERPRDRTPGSK
jgi:predicted ATPase/class 3 adenylate cyclase/DNA-binding NarL/FixJ family response regulator